jgi:hypothetical protein
VRKQAALRMTATPPDGEWLFSFEVPLLEVGESFRHFDIRSPGIFDECDRDAKLGHLGVGTIQFDALGFEPSS